MEKDQDDTTSGSNPDIEKLIQQRLEEHASGLKNKNQELIDKNSRLSQENKALAEQLKAWDGLDPEQVKNIVKRIGEDEEAKLLAEGKQEEVINRRIKTVLDRNSKQLEQALAELEETKNQASEYSAKYRSAVIDNAVARNLKGLEDGALPRVQAEVRAWYQLDDEGQVVPSEKAPLNKKGQGISLKELNEHLIDATPFYFKRSNGAGITGTNSTGTGGLSYEQLQKLKPIDRIKFVRRQQGG